MITFVIALLLLVFGYLLYGRLIEKMVEVDPNRPTPAITMADGVDYVPMKPWRIFLIQFLNIAGVGPIVGAIMGAQFGTASFLWIVFGCIFGGAVHDFVSGYVSLRNKGCSLPEIHGRFLGNGAKQFMRYFTVILMILVGAVFVKTPSQLLFTNFTPDWQIWIWPVIIFVYYMLATMLPIDKLIGRIYPIFGILLLVNWLAKRRPGRSGDLRQRISSIYRQSAALTGMLGKKRDAAETPREYAEALDVYRYDVKERLPGDVIDAFGELTGIYENSVYNRPGDAERLLAGADGCWDRITAALTERYGKLRTRRLMLLSAAKAGQQKNFADTEVPEEPDPGTGEEEN